MFEKLKEIGLKGVYVIHSADFDAIELMNLMAPSFIVAVEGGKYVVVFDPRSATVMGLIDNAPEEEAKKLREIFGDLVGMELKVGKKSDGGGIEGVLEDVDFYEGMGVVVLETDERTAGKRHVGKAVDRFKIFTMISKYTRDQRYSPEELFLSISPGMAGMSVFVSVDTRFMVWLKNETAVEGDKFRYSLIRAFNVVVAKIVRKFNYERMSILPYETMVIINRNVEKLQRFLRVVDVVNEKIKPYLVENFPVWISKMKSFEKADILESIKSKEEFFDSVAAIPDRRGVEMFKSRIISAIDNFDSQLAVITKELGKWMDGILGQMS